MEEYKEVNRKESLDLADAFLSTKYIISTILLFFLSSFLLYQLIFSIFRFLEGQEQFLKSKGKNAMIFTILKHTRPLWSKLL